MGVQPFVIVIDGPAGSGKGSHAKRIADHFEYRHIDTGLMYRAVAWKVLEIGANPVAAAQALQEEELVNPRLRSVRVDNLVHRISPIAEVRNEVNAFLHRLLATPPGSVIDGRAGAREFSHARIKIYLDADVRKRAAWRVAQNRARGEETDFEKVLANLCERDLDDSHRSIAPLKYDPDVYDALIDASKLDEEAAFRSLRTLCERLIFGRERAIAV